MLRATLADPDKQSDSPRRTLRRPSEGRERRKEFTSKTGYVARRRTCQASETLKPPDAAQVWSCRKVAIGPDAAANLLSFGGTPRLCQALCQAGLPPDPLTGRGYAVAIICWINASALHALSAAPEPPEAQRKLTSPANVSQATELALKPARACADGATNRTQVTNCRVASHSTQS